MAYEITNVTSHKIEFKHKDNYIDININEFKDYRKCSEFHYYNEQTNDMIVINGYYRLIYFDNVTGKVYRRAKQWEFDYWHTIHHPESDNAKVYHYVIKI